MQLTDHTPAERSIMLLANVIQEVALRHPGLGRALRDPGSTATFSLDFRRLADRLEHYYLVTQERGRMLNEAALQVREAKRSERKLAHLEKRHAKVSAQVKRVMDALPPVNPHLSWDKAVIAVIKYLEGSLDSAHKSIFAQDIEALQADREALRLELAHERQARQLAEAMLARSSAFSFQSTQARELEETKRRLEAARAAAQGEQARALKAESRVHALETGMRALIDGPSTVAGSPKATQVEPWPW